MRRPLLVLSVLSALALTGIHCAYAQPRGPGACSSSPDVAHPTSTAPRIEIVDDSMQKLATFCHDDRRYVLGDLGERYWIRIVNPTAARIEAVVSVDGLDAVDGRPASVHKRGYIVPAFGEVLIDGWRTSFDTVAAFRFSTVPDSYAGRTEHERNVGVIGAAFFRERAQARVVQTRPFLAPSAAARAPSAPAADAAESKAGGSSAPAGAAAEGAPTPAPAARRGLGTEFGESQESRVVETAFSRADSSPWIVTELRYDDRNGLISRGISIPTPQPENELRDTAQAFPDSRFAQPPR